MSKLRVNSLVNKTDTAGPSFLNGATIPSGQIFTVQGNVSVTGTCTATSFVGNGSNLTNLGIVGQAKVIALKLILDPDWSN